MFWRRLAYTVSFLRCVPSVWFPCIVLVTYFSLFLFIFPCICQFLNLCLCSSDFRFGFAFLFFLSSVCLYHSDVWQIPTIKFVIAYNCLWLLGFYSKHIKLLTSHKFHQALFIQCKTNNNEEQAESCSWGFHTLVFNADFETGYKKKKKKSQKPFYTWPRW